MRLDGWLFAVCAAGTCMTSAHVFGGILDLTNVSGPLPTTWGWAFVALGAGGLGAAYCAWGLAPDRVRAARTAATRVDVSKI